MAHCKAAAIIGNQSPVRFVREGGDFTMTSRELGLPDTDTPGRLGRYQIDQEIGRGFSSIVYQATHTGTGRLVALKVLTAPLSLAPARRREMSGRFEREARAVSALSHPAIVSIVDVGRADDERQFLAMELLEGETLRARLDRPGPMLQSEALPLMIQIADALQYAHGRGIIHRDVKPDNIFLCADGRAKLMDFGVAHAFADDGLTQTGMVIGSPAYMSPEQINGDTLDGRTDVFSLAVTLVEALTAQKPFDGPSIPAVMNRILNHPPQIAGITARPLRKAVEQALAKTPGARTSSAGAFAEALRRALPMPGSLETVTGTQVMPMPSFAARHQKTVRPRGEWWGWGAVAAALIVLVALPLLSHRSTARQPAQTMAAAAVPPKITAEYVHPLPQTSLPVTIVESPPPRTFHKPIASLDDPAAAKNVPLQVRITENPPAAEKPPNLAVLRDLRDQSIVPAQPRVIPIKHRSVPKPSRPALPSPPTNSPLPISATISLPRLLQRSLPIVPGTVNRSALPTTVDMLVSVNEQGTVYSAQVTQSSGDPTLDSAAIASVLRWRYAPALKNGVPAAATIAAHIDFPG
jgi:TonB family protein